MTVLVPAGRLAGVTASHENVRDDTPGAHPSAVKARSIARLEALGAAALDADPRWQRNPRPAPGNTSQASP